MTRQELEFALQMLENAVALDPDFALAYALIANVCAQTHSTTAAKPSGWNAPRRLPERLSPSAPICRRAVRKGGSCTPQASTTTRLGLRAAGSSGSAIARGPTTSWGARCSPRDAIRHRQFVDAALEAGGRTTTSTFRS